jgi:hypothetical protein
MQNPSGNIEESSGSMGQAQALNIAALEKERYDDV